MNPLDANATGEPILIAMTWTQHGHTWRMTQLERGKDKYSLVLFLGQHSGQQVTMGTKAECWAKVDEYEQEPIEQMEVETDG